MPQTNCHPVFVHEAGHLVAMISLGMKPHAVECNPVTGAGWVQYRQQDHRYGRRRSAKAARNRVLFDMAGLVAEEYLSHRGHSLWNLSSKYHDVISAIKAVTEAQPGTFPVSGCRAAREIGAGRCSESINREFLLGCATHVFRFVVDHQDVIMEVAKMLHLGERNISMLTIAARGSLQPFDRAGRLDVRAAFQA